MTMYNLHLEKDAQRDLLRLDMPTRKRLVKHLKWLGTHFDEIEPIALAGAWAGHFKFRVGDYRVIYQVNHTEQRINVSRIRHRREVYE